MILRNLVLTCIVAVAVALGVSRISRAEDAAPSTSPAAHVEATHNAEASHDSAAHSTATGGHKAGETHQDPVDSQLDAITLVASIAIFVLLLVVLRFTAWKPIMAGLQSREQAIRESIEAAERARVEADRTTRELEAKMAQVQQEASLQLAQAKADAVKLADTIRAQAEAESAALKDRTVRDIEAAKQQALSEINAHAATLGTAVARKILQREVTASDQQRLVDESLAELAKKN